MGYRSDIEIICTETDWQFLIGESLVKQIPLFKPDQLLELGWLNGEKMLHIILNGVKWYDNYVDVGLVEEWMNNLSERDRPIAFSRIGEESDDIELREDHVNDIYFTLYRQIEIDHPFTPSLEESTEE